MLYNYKGGVPKVTKFSFLSRCTRGYGDRNYSLIIQVIIKGNPCVLEDMVKHNIVGIVKETNPANTCDNQLN